jgi:outer membrane receptor protein involved in Fe transport
MKKALKENGFDLVNFRVTYLPPKENYEVAVFVTNLLDEEYIVAGGGALDSFGTAEYTPGRPRELGVSLKYFF